jgi:hypothetical protein
MLPAHGLTPNQKMVAPGTAVARQIRVTKPLQSTLDGHRSDQILDGSRPATRVGEAGVWTIGTRRDYMTRIAKRKGNQEGVLGQTSLLDRQQSPIKPIAAFGLFASVVLTD